MSRHVHSAARSKTYPYTGAVTGGDAQNPAAHGNICIMESCCCGARRYANVNGRHVEQCEWDLPEWVGEANPEAIAFRPGDARRLLVALASSVAGRLAIEAAGYGMILDSPDRGDDAGSLLVARAAMRELRRASARPGLGGAS